MSSTPSAVELKLNKVEYQNWLAVGHAFDLMSVGIRPYIVREMETLYNHLKTLPQCGCIYDTSRTKNPYHDMTSCHWATSLQSYHQSNRPNWHQSDRSKWMDPNFGCWEVAKLFMSGLGKQKTVVVDAESTDVTGLMNILCWCNKFNTLLPYAQQVRDARNMKWAHTPNLEISSVDKASAIQSIENLLSCTQFNGDLDAQNSLQQIKGINIHFDARNLERKILLAFINTCHTYQQEVQNELDNLKEGGISNNRKVGKLQKRLLDLESTLKKSNQRKQNKECNWFFFTLLLMLRILCSVRKSSKIYLLAVVMMTFAVQLDPNTYGERCPSEDRSIRFDVREFNFTRSLTTAKQGFIGRSWLYEDVYTRLKNGSSFVLIVGEPGSGKSAVAAQLVCSRRSEPSIHRNIIAYHLCQYYDKETQEPARFIRSLVDMIGRRVSAYENIIFNMSLTQRLERRYCNGNPRECFEEAIIMPWKQIEESNQLSPDTRYYIVVDALDECIPTQGGSVTNIVDLIKDKVSRFPKALKIIATTRNDSEIIHGLKPIAQVVEINPFDERNERDIDSYIDLNYPRSWFRDYFKLPSNNLHSAKKLSQDLLRISQGNFLFVKLVVDYVRNDPSGDTVMPTTLGDVYKKYFSRAFPTREKYMNICGVLEILVSTLTPLTDNEIFKILVLENNKLTFHYFKKDLSTLSHFLRFSKNNTMTLFHRSLMDWLTSEENGKFSIDKKEGNKKLMLYYLDVVRRNGTANAPGSIFHLAQHIAYAELYSQYEHIFRNISADVIQRYRSIDDNSTFLHLAAIIEHTDVIKLVLPFFRDDVDCVDLRGYTAAFLSASRGLLENVKLLVQHGANVNHTTNPPPLLPFRSFQDPVVISKREYWGSTMLHVASYQGYLHIVKFLLEKNAGISERNGVSMTAIELASENGHLEIVELLWKNSSEAAGNLALHHSAMNGYTDVVKFLLEKEITDDCLICNGSFYWLGESNRYQSLWFDIKQETFSKLVPNYSIIAEVKAEKGVHYELHDDRSLLFCETALHVAVARGHVDVVRALLSHTISAIHCTDFTGRTPLHIAASKNDYEIMGLLIDADVNINPKCSFSQLLEPTANSQMFYLKKYQFLSLKEEKEYFEDMCSCDHTPIDVAARYGQIESAKLLLHHNGKLATKSDCDGASPIHIAACYGQHHFIHWLMKYINYVTLDMASANGSTPLHSAAYCGNYEEVKRLISDGANPRATDKNKMTVLHYAILPSINYEYGGAASHLKAFSDYNLTFIISTSRGKKMELYYENELIRIWRSKKSTHFSIKKKREVNEIPELVRIGANCRTVDELLKVSTSDDRIFYLNAKDAKGRTALQLAILNGVQCASIVLMKRLSPHQNDSFGISVLDSISENFAFIMSRKSSLKIVRIFFEKYLLIDSLSKHRFLISYLQNRYRRPHLQTDETLLLDLEFSVKINCSRIPFNQSEFNLLSYWPPTNDDDNFFYTRDDDSISSVNAIWTLPVIRGPLLKAIDEHPLGKEVINRCRDLEGYTPLHRAAQGGNIVAIRVFLVLGADIQATTADNWKQTLSRSPSTRVC